MKWTWIVAVLLLAFAAPAHAVTTGMIREVTIEQLQKGCDAREFGDCDLLGRRYLAGIGVPKDAKKAAVLFDRACEGGNAEGCHDLAESYRLGEGLAKNDAKSTAYFQRGCDQGSALSCAWLALAYGDGTGIKQDDNKAALYADRSCKGNSRFGCGILGRVYLQGAGSGYQKDLARAKEYLTIGCLDGANFFSKADIAARSSCPALTKLTGEPACGASYGNARYCYEAGVWQRITVAAPSSPAAPAKTAQAQPQAAADPFNPYGLSPLALRNQRKTLRDVRLKIIKEKQELILPITFEELPLFCTLFITAKDQKDITKLDRQSIVDHVRELYPTYDLAQKALSKVSEKIKKLNEINFVTPSSACRLVYAPPSNF